VDEEQGFASGLSDAIGNWGLADAGFNYHLLSVFGSQSTGKSTLLNRVFGTGFQVMNETERRQTTKGNCFATVVWYVEYWRRDMDVQRPRHARPGHGRRRD
jgi:hypothetical protein